MGTSDDMASSFGPRHYGPDNYDFHRGIDISAHTDNTADAIRTATIVRILTNSIIAEDNDGYLTRYSHISNSGLVENVTQITEGSQFTTIQSGGDHLDIKYYEYVVENFDEYSGYYDSPLDLVTYLDPYDGWQNLWAADHPMRLLPYTNWDSNFEAYVNLMVLYDEQLGHYIEAMARVDDDELDLDRIVIYLSAQTTFGYVNEHDLLRGEYDWVSGIDDNIVNYEDRINCGDISYDDSDTGYNNGIKILPNSFSRNDPYHTVYFRFYLDEAVFSSVTGYILADFRIHDIRNNSREVNNADIFTCIECDPPPSAPPAPDLEGAFYQAEGATIRLEWSSGGDPEAVFYKVYRCLSSEQMTDDDAIGITSQFDESNEVFFYEDDGVDLTLIDEIAAKLMVAWLHASMQSCRKGFLILNQQFWPPFMEHLRIIIPPPWAAFCRWPGKSGHAP